MKQCIRCHSQNLKFCSNDNFADEFVCMNCNQLHRYPIRRDILPLQELANKYKMLNQAHDMRSKCCDATLSRNYYDNSIYCSKCIKVVDDSAPVTTKGAWKKEGKCPTCGELGRFSNFALVCSVHGVYT